MEDNVKDTSIDIEFNTFDSDSNRPDTACLDNDFDEDIHAENDRQCLLKFYKVRNNVFKYCAARIKVIQILSCVLALCLYLAYVAYALYLHHGERKVTGLKVITCILFLVLVINGVSRYDPIGKWNAFLKQHPSAVRHSKRLVYLSCFAVTCVTMVTEVILVRPESLLSISGVLSILIIFFVTSTHPHKITWQPVFLGLFLQYVFALAILRLPGIKETFAWCGDVVTLVVTFSKAGGRLLFGSLYLNDGFVFHLVPLLAFAIAILSVLEHLGILHALLKILGRFLSFCTGASPAESLNASANIFMGPIDSLMVIRPYLKYVTPSELHCLMANGMSTVTGSIMGLYISFGISADHLLAASVMSAPAALAVAKLSVPEVHHRSKAMKKMEEMIPAKRYRSVMDAFSSGAVSAFTLAAAILANVIALVSFMELVNATLRWLGDLVDVQNLTLQWICSYLFYPLALSLGVDMTDGHKVAELLGIKVFINELVAYSELGQLRKNRLELERYMSHNFTDWYWSSSHEDVYLPSWNLTLKDGFLSMRSEVITTYALCGFANFVSVGVIIGCYLVLVPQRKTTIFKYVLRSMIVGHCASFMTACIAGLFIS